MNCLKKCQGCYKIEVCRIRGAEWMKNITLIMSKKRKKGEGVRMAEEIIDYMENKFMPGEIPF